MISYRTPAALSHNYIKVIKIPQLIMSLLNVLYSMMLPWNFRNIFPINIEHAIERLLTDKPMERHEH